MLLALELVLRSPPMSALVRTGLLCAFALGAVACGEARPPNVVILMLDTARPDYLSVYGHERPTTPFLESFGAQGARFDRAYSSSSWSLPAHASIFTGLPPRVHRADQTHTVVSASLPLLAEDLRARGFRTGAFSANLWIGAKTGLDRGFERFEDLSKRKHRPHIEALATDPVGQHRPPEQHHVVAPILAWLEETRADPRPFFLFVNLLEPHMPYLPDASALAPFASDPEARWKAIQSFYPDGKAGVVSFRHYRRSDPLDAREWGALTAMYEGALRLTDELTATIVRALDRVAPPEETLVFVLSDHGENLGDHGHFQHVFNLYDSNQKIALLARGPGYAPGRAEEGLVQIADVHATILAAAGAPERVRPGTIDLRAAVPAGRVLTAELDFPKESLLMFPEDVREEGAMQVYARALLAAVGPRFKLIRGSDGSEELYDLAADPGELRPLTRAEIEPAALAELEAALARLQAETPAPLGDEAARVHDAEELEVLRALGYVGDEESTPQTPAVSPREAMRAARQNREAKKEGSEEREPER